MAFPSMISVFNLRILFAILLAFSLGCSCTGDCASCHSTLDYKNDSRHAPMLECKTCHTQEKMAKLKMGDTCGADCFACHKPQKLESPELKPTHKVIQSCISCHQNLDKDILNKSIIQRDFIQDFFNRKK